MEYLTQVKTVRAANPCNEENFRKDVKDLMQKEDACLVVSYSRPALKQTGLNLMQKIKRILLYFTCLCR